MFFHRVRGRGHVVRDRGARGAHAASEAVRRRVLRRRVLPGVPWYIIRRRRAPTADHPEIAGEERLRISAGLHGVQEEPQQLRGAQISTESDAVVAGRYDELVRRTRAVAGTYMHEAWETPALGDDAGMNMRLDYDELTRRRTSTGRGQGGHDFLASCDPDVA